ncbi:MAG TPA: tRNA 2-selenouridine(34) synthase MnmH [Tetragenococcus sp.]|nr:tRNA 2-selenouridine(34) synthase MnmH [Tetragenococcus sp.]
MFRDIALSDLLKKQEKNLITLVDVRSPKEFAEFRMPGSINIPLFTNEEHAEVGTLYKQVSIEAAKNKGLEIFSAKLPQFIATFQQLEKAPIVYCSRGGMRSKIAATVVDLMGMKVLRLAGGIRSYRKWTVKQLAAESFAKRMYVLNGYTGSGKTLLLKHLKDQNYPVLDLEAMANHRGSVFGEVGLVSNNQRAFDSLLVKKLYDYKESSFWLLEGESRRIGKVCLPQALFERKEASTQLFIHLPLEKRVENILQDYQPEKYQAEVNAAFQRIKKHIHLPIAKKISQDLVEKNYPEAIALLLEYYYDPLYEHTLAHYAKNKQVHIQASSLEEAVAAVKNFIAENE